jgi:hypothetical protein
MHNVEFKCNISSTTLTVYHLIVVIIVHIRVRLFICITDIINGIIIFHLVNVTSIYEWDKYCYNPAQPGDPT